MPKSPEHLVAKYVNEILNNIDFLKGSVEKCDPKAIEHSAKIIRLAKDATEKDIVTKSDYDRWMFMVDNFNRRFINKCSCIDKEPQEIYK